MFSNKRYTLHYATYEKSLPLRQFLIENNVDFDVCAAYSEPFEMFLVDNQEDHKFHGEKRIREEIEKLVPFNFSYSKYLQKKRKNEVWI